MCSPVVCGTRGSITTGRDYDKVMTRPAEWCAGHATLLTGKAVKGLFCTLRKDLSLMTMLYEAPV